MSTDHEDIDEATLRADAVTAVQEFHAALFSSTSATGVTACCVAVAESVQLWVVGDDVVAQLLRGFGSLQQHIESIKAASVATGHGET